MDAINQDVLKQLQEYARRYFAAIVELNTVNGKCNLAPGKYSAKQLIDNSHKSVFGHCFALPEDEVYNENITVQSGTFRASFPYRRIFAILADWEAMSKAGKLKTVFEIEGAEEKSTKVMTSERTVLGAYKEKKMTLRRIRGNWWGEVKEIRKNKGYSGYYELNGVMFQGGGKTFFGEPEHESTVNFCEKHGDDEMKTAILNYIVQNPRSEFCAYYSEVLSRAGISMDNQEATAIMEAAREEKRKRDEEEARELAERKAREEEARRKRQEMETRVKRQMAEKLAKAKEDFVSGNKISEEDFEDIAASIGYEINIRTVGTLRKRVEWIEVDSEVTPTVYGTKRRAGLEGTFEVIREVYTKVKELAATPKETPQISTQTAETTELSAEATKAEEAPKYSISERDGNVYVTFKRGVIRQCAKRCGVSCKSAEWNTIAQAYNGTHSDMGWGLSFSFDGREDAVRFAELVCNGDISGYYKLYMDKIIAEGEARKKRIAEECAEYDAAQAYFAECMADEDAETVNVSAESEKEAERAFISMCVKHHKEHAPAYSHYSLYRHNDTMFAFGKEAEITREYFQDNKYCPLSEVEREHNGEKYLCFHVSDYNGDIKGRIRDLMEQKHIAEYGTPSNGLITIWDAEEVEYWNRNVTPIEPPQSPEAPQTVECATDTPKPRETVEKRPNRTAGCAQRARRSGLGANGYSMLDYASAMLAAMNVPRKCSTELSPPGYVPPIRGDCTNCKRPTNDHITDLKPP